MRNLDRQIERWAWQLATPDAAKPDVADLESAIDRLRRLAADDGEAARKASILLRRADELHRSATSRRALAKHTLEPASAPRSLVPAQKAAACSGAVKLPVGEWIVDPASTAEGLWLAFTAPEAGTWIVHTAGSRADTKLERWSDCAAFAPTEVNDDGIGLRSRLVIELEAGETVRFRLKSTADDRVLVAATRGTTGSLSGRVTAAVTGEALSGARLEIYSLASFGFSYHGSALTDAEGLWEFTGLQPGEYLVRTDFYSSSYINQIYDDIDCLALEYCVLSDGTPITVEGAPVSGIDFVLHRGATISGRVLEEATGLAIAEAWVDARNATGSWSDTTDPAGRYEIRGLRGDEVRVLAASQSHRNERWPDEPCEASCNDSVGAPISIALDEEVEGIDFRLERLGSISGRVTSVSTGLPLAFVSITIFDAATGEASSSASTDSSGRYVAGGLEAGEYRVKASDFEILPTYWPNEICLSNCLSAGDAVSVVTRERVENIDLVVSSYGSIEGEVVDSETAEAAEHGSIQVYDDAGVYLDDDFLYQGGYEVSRIRPGSVHVVFSSSLYQDEVWNDVACSIDQTCDPLAGDPVEVAPGSTVQEIDFVVAPYQDLEGRVTWEGTGEPVADVEIEVRDRSSTWGGSRYASTDSEGRYIIRNLPPGTYSVQTRSAEALDELYDDLPCEGSSGCDLSTGTGVVVGLGAPTTGVDFALARFASFRGTVRDSGSGEPLSGGGIRLYDDTGSFYRSTSVHDDGTYEIVGVEAGTYFLAARFFEDHLDRDVGAGNCSDPIGDCDPLSGTAFVVELGEEIVQDVDLVLGGAFEGRVVDSNGASLSGQVYAFDSSGRELGYDWTDGSGNWRLSKLTAGAPHVLFYARGAVSTWWPDQPVADSCPWTPCDPTGAPSVPIALGETKTLDFVVDRLGSLSGNVVDSQTGEIVSNVSIDLYRADGTYYETDYISNLGFRFDFVDPEPLYLVVRSASRHLEQVYGGEHCDPNCDPATGTPLTVPLGATTSITVPVDPGPGVSGRVLDAVTGLPIAGVGLDFWKGSAKVESTASALDGSFRLFASGGGTYYLSTDTGTAYGDIVWEGVDCPDGPAFEGECDPTTGTPIVLGDHQPLVPIEIRLEGGTSPMIFRDGFESGTMGAWSVNP